VFHERSATENREVVFEHTLVILDKQDKTPELQV